MDMIVGRALRLLGTSAVLAIATVALASCGSKTVQSTGPTATVGAPTSGSAAKETTPTKSGDQVGSATIAVECPTAAVVSAAMGRTQTGPVTESNDVGGQRTTACSYPVSGRANGALTTVSFVTFASAVAESAAKAQWAAKETSVSGLGDAAYSNPSAGALVVFGGSVMLSINSAGASSAQLEDLARKLVR